VAVIAIVIASVPIEGESYFQKAKRLLQGIRRFLLPKRERLISHPNKLCKACVPNHPAKGGFDVRTMVVFFFVDYQ